MVRIATAAKPGDFAQLPQRVAHVLQEIVDERQPLLVVVVFPDRLYGAKLQHCLTASLGRRHAGAKILGREQSEMLLHLRPQPFIAVTPSGKVCRTGQGPPQESHGKSSAFTSKNRAMIAAVCSHSRVSDVSSLLPARVSR